MPLGLDTLAFGLYFRMNAKSSAITATRPIYFVIGTRAQFIKVAPIMRAMLDEGISYLLIYTAQHRENIREILEVYKLPEPDITMYSRREANTQGGFLLWFVDILYKVFFQSKKYIQ